MSPPKLTPAREKELLGELRPLFDQTLDTFNPGKKRRALTPGTALASLGLDSLAFVGLLGDVEAHLKMRFSDEAMGATTVREFLAYAQEALDAKGRKKPGKKPPTRRGTKKAPTKKPPTKKRSTKKAPTKKPPTKKRSTKKAPTKKAPTKKPPTKKRSTKKAPTKKGRRG